MSAQIRQLIEELRQGAEMTAEGASSILWRDRIRAMPAVSVAAHGLGLSLLWSSSRTLLLQRGQIGPHGDMELRGVLVALSNILEMELAAQESAKQTRADERGGQPYYLRDSA